MEALTKVDERLLRLAEFLTEEFRTARDIQKKFRCTRATAHARLAALSARGAKFRTLEQRQGVHGPISKAWQLKAAPIEWR
jgi:hypothetical protein